MINEGGIAKVEEHIADALKRGATLVTGGKRLSGPSLFLLKYGPYCMALNGATEHSLLEIK